MHSYRFLQNLATTIDEKVKQITLGSMVYNSKSTNDTMSQFDMVIELNERKKNIINLKVVTEKCVSMLKQKELEVITLYYFDGLDVSDICDTLEISIRTFYRRKEMAIGRISEFLYKNYRKNYFLDNFGKETWLVDLYQYYLKKSKIRRISEEGMEDGALNGREIFRALKEIRKIAV